MKTKNSTPTDAISSAARPSSALTLCHIALFSTNYEASRHFYVEIMGMRVDWEPDTDNAYLSNGSDNLAIHRVQNVSSIKETKLDHIGFVVAQENDVDQWYDYLESLDISIHAEPKTHRDGARSFYVKDPDDVVVQILYHPRISVD